MVFPLITFRILPRPLPTPFPTSLAYLVHSSACGVAAQLTNEWSCSFARFNSSISLIGSALAYLGKRGPPFDNAQATVSIS